MKNLPGLLGFVLLARALHRAVGPLAARLDLIHPGALKYFREAGLAR
jgi:hypothetical protein